MTIKTATWNVNSLKVRLTQVLNWISQNKADILALQETKVLDEHFPLAAIQSLGYQVIFSGQKTYNGVAILSQIKAVDIITDIPDFIDLRRRILVSTINNIRIINLHVPNGQVVGSEKYEYKLKWLEHITSFISQQLQKYEKLIVLGDFNIAPTDRDVYDPESWREKVLCSTPERAMFQRLVELGLKDTFRLFNQTDKSYTWWDYRMLAFRRNLGLRIDHILVSEALANVCKNCWIDKEPRKLQQPSDHTPVVAEFSC